MSVQPDMTTASQTDAPDLEVHEKHEHILILDFGSQVTQLIARRLRESGVYCEIWPFNQVDEAKVKAFDPKGIIFSGGPCSVLDRSEEHTSELQSRSDIECRILLVEKKYDSTYTVWFR